MKIIHTTFAGFAVYLAMAACSAADHAASIGPDLTQAPPPAPSVTSTVGAIVDAMADVFVDPVKDANAAPAPPEAVTEQCDKVLDVNGTPRKYAEHVYPGATRDELVTSVVVLVPIAQGLPPGYGYSTQLPWAKDGSAGFFCVDGLASLTFVRRP